MEIAAILSLIKNNWKIIAISTALIGYGYFWYDFGANHIQKEWDATIIQMQKEANARSVKLEKDLADQRAKNAKTNAKLERALHESTDYANCHVTANGLLALREAIGTR